MGVECEFAMKSHALVQRLAARVLARKKRQFAARRAVLRAALRAAHSADSDEGARQRLKTELQADVGCLSQALDFLRTRRDRFDFDRAYRLLDAAITDTPVEPIAVDRHDLFIGEEQLGRMPLSEAFVFLAKRRPVLNQFERAAKATNGVTQTLLGDDAEAEDDMGDTPPHVSAVLGPGAQDCTNPLLRSQLALSIASQHLAILAGSHDGDDSCSYFASPKKRMTLSSGFDRR
jgi:hypothetical protein